MAISCEIVDITVGVLHLLVQVKSYSCDLTDGLLSSLVVPGSLLVQCNTGLTGNQTLPPTDNTTTAGGNGTAKSALLRMGGAGRRLRQLEGSSCRISFRVADPGVDVICDATECTMSAGAPFAICNTGSCGCPGGCDNGGWRGGAARQVGWGQAVLCSWVC